MQSYDAPAQFFEMTETDGWDIQSAISLYNIDRWGTGYFSVNARGNIEILPTQTGPGIDMMEVIADAKEQGLSFPLVIRFQDLLRHRVEKINRSFEDAIREANYQNVYRGVFPIKVNQLREVVEEIIDAGRPFHFGIEAGSKPELTAALAIHNDPESLIICNGYKDNTFIQNALLGRKLGKKVFMVVEKLEELFQILQVSREVGVEPLIGLRVRLQSKGAGKWATSGGEKSKFGLSTADLVVAAFGSIEKSSAPISLDEAKNESRLVRDMRDLQRNLSAQNRMESLHDAQQNKEQAQSMFDLGLLDLENKAKIETLYWQIAQAVVENSRGAEYVPDEVKEAEIALGDQYVCNFSVFQSLLDHWALGQLFPIMPVHRLNERPERNATLVDITCDSDGKVSKFIDLQDVKDTLPLHKLIPGEIYYLGVFMVGAYQDIMGDLHNLFGRVTEAHIFLDPDEESGWYIEEVIEGS